MFGLASLVILGTLRSTRRCPTNMMFGPREMAKTAAFFQVPKAPFLGASNTAPDRNPSICRALRPWGLAGWWRRTGRHFSSGRHQRVARSALARGETDISLLSETKAG